MRRLPQCNQEIRGGIGITGDGNADNRSCQMLSVDGACLPLVTFVVPTPVKTIITKLFRPAFGVLPKTGDAEPVDRGIPG